MQFVSVIVFTLALVIGVQSSIIAWPHTHTEIAGHGLSYTAVSGPAHVLTHVPVWDHHGHVVVHGHPWVSHWPAWDPHAHAHAHVIDVHDHGAGSHVVVNASSGSGGSAVNVEESSGAAGVVVAPAHEGTYLAETRGAIHTAPLPGHANSVSSINIEPAPGTV